MSILVTSSRYHSRASLNYAANAVYGLFKQAKVEEDSEEPLPELPFEVTEMISEKITRRDAVNVVLSCREANKYASSFKN